MAVRATMLQLRSGLKRSVLKELSVEWHDARARTGHVQAWVLLTKYSTLSVNVYSSWSKEVQYHAFCLLWNAIFPGIWELGSVLVNFEQIQDIYVQRKLHRPRDTVQSGSWRPRIQTAHAATSPPIAKHSWGPRHSHGTSHLIGTIHATHTTHATHSWCCCHGCRSGTSQVLCHLQPTGLFKQPLLLSPVVSKNQKEKYTQQNEKSFESPANSIHLWFLLLFGFFGFSMILRWSFWLILHSWILQCPDPFDHVTQAVKSNGHMFLELFQHNASTGLRVLKQKPLCNTLFKRLVLSALLYNVYIRV